jgi:putative flippase GtrA
LLRRRATLCPGLPAQEPAPIRVPRRAERRRAAVPLGPERLVLAREFLRFGVVGTIGFAVDTAVLYAAIGLAGTGPYGGRLLSYLVAATTTWALNRHWTFRDRNNTISPIRQWISFLVVNLAGFASNYGTYAALLALSPFCARHPVIGVAAGAIAGMAGNFFLSRRFVFGARPGRGP